MSRETLERLKAQIAEQQRTHGENAREAGYLKNNANVWAPGVFGWIAV